MGDNKNQYLEVANQQCKDPCNKQDLYLNRIKEELSRLLSNNNIPEDIKKSLLEMPELVNVNSVDGGSHVG